MRLSAQQEQTFLAHGFIVLPSVFAAEEVRAARDAFERLYATAQTLRTTTHHEGAYFVLDGGRVDGGPADGTVIVKRVVWAGGAEPVLLRLGEDPRLLEPVLQLLDSPRCEQLLSQAHFKMPGDGVSFDWHQDIQHRDKGPGTWRDVNGRGSYVQSILLVDDMRVDNGPLQFVPPDAAQLDDNHRLLSSNDDYGAPAADTLRPQPAHATVPTVDASRAVTVTGRAGDVLLFGPYAIHGSLPNTSTVPRRVLINGYAAPGANSRVYPGVGSCRTLPAP